MTRAAARMWRMFGRANREDGFARLHTPPPQIIARSNELNEARTRIQALLWDAKLILVREQARQKEAER
jgi:hypothetical protein